MSHWNLKRAARLGYLAGRGLSVESIMARSAPRWSEAVCSRPLGWPCHLRSYEPAQRMLFAHLTSDSVEAIVESGGQWLRPPMQNLQRPSSSITVPR
jgi:hypothetical protein